MISLEVKVDSYIESQIHTSANTPVVWSKMGGYHPPGLPHRDDTPWVSSQDWSAPAKEAGTRCMGPQSGFVQWKQTAVVCSWLNKEKSGLRDVCHVDVRILKTRHELSLRHVVGEKTISVPLSTRPWTSGIFRDNANSTISAVSDGLESPDSSAPPPYITRA